MSLSSFSGAFAFVTVISAVIFWKSRLRCGRRNVHNLPHPPGPRPLPLIGNLLDFPRQSEVAAYLKLAHQYGDLFFMQVFGRNILFVNSFQAARSLFEASANYSDRNHSVMLHELMGWEWTFGHMPYGDAWKAHRRMFSKQFQQSNISVFWPILRTETYTLLQRLLHSPQDLMEHLRFNSASLIMNLTYGINIAPKNDRYVEIAEKALAGMAEAAKPGAFLVDFLPPLKHMPEWLPGAEFKKKAEEWKAAVMEMRDAPFKSILQKMRTGTAPICFVSNLINEFDSTNRLKENIEIIKAAAGMSYAAGTESFSASLSSFMLAMVLYPDVKRKAQEELDNVLNHARLPDFNDRKNLPYISAVVKEVLRWSPVAPLGLPHMVTRDDEYGGYFIPAGTTVVGNSWAILHDPHHYPMPEVFNPNRFLDKEEGYLSPADPLSATFGYGRRICPGRFIADVQLWLCIACILSVFNITPGVDGNGEVNKVEASFTSGMIRHPLPFKFEIVPRGEYVKTLIEQTIENS